MKTVFIDPNLSGMISQNVGLAYVLSSVEKEHAVRLLDLTFQANGYKKYILTELAREKPDLIGLSVTSFSLPASLEISRLIKSSYPEIQIIWGGGYPTLFPEESINYPCVDAVCIGEGEISALEYLNRLNDGRKLDVEGIWHKDKKGQVHRNRLRPFNENIDALAFPDWGHWNIEKHLQKNLYFVPGAIKLLASRGCPYNCSFCSNEAIRRAIPGKYYRQRSPENIVAEIKMNAAKYSAKGFKTIHFADEIFGLHQEFLQDFCALFKEEGLDKEFSWCCATRPDVLTQDWVRIAKDAGCVWVWLGVESGDEDIRNKVYRKNISTEQIIKATGYLRDFGIAYNFSLMIGCPEDTRETIARSMELVKQTRPSTFDVSFYQPLPKTELGLRVLQTMETKEAALLKQPNHPRMPTLSLTLGDLEMIMWRIRLIKLFRFLLLGLKTKKAAFLIDIVKYVFSINGCRSISLNNPIISMDVQLKTIFKYAAQAEKRQSPKSKAAPQGQSG